jgi:methionine sulfoxide reductase heme-binding subunit
VRLLIPPLRDYSGRFSPLKTAVFIGLFVPASFTFYYFATGTLGARPLTEALHEMGDWTIRFIFLALAVSPLSQLWQWPRIQLVRRMIGVTAFAYAVAHLTLYTADEMFNLAKVASEIVLRFYLTIGFIAWLGLAALAATSTDGMIRRLGARKWQRLHRFIYVIGLLAVTHYFLQSKLNEWQPTMMAGLLFWLLGYRVLRWLYGRSRKVGPVAAGFLSLAAGFGTIFGEAGYFWLAYHVPLARIIPAEFSTLTGIRPGWAVLGLGAAVTLIAALRAFQAKHAKKVQLSPAA